MLHQSPLPTTMGECSGTSWIWLGHATIYRACHDLLRASTHKDDVTARKVFASLIKTTLSVSIFLSSKRSAEPDLWNEVIKVIYNPCASCPCHICHVWFLGAPYCQNVCFCKVVLCNIVNSLLERQNVAPTDDLILYTIDFRMQFSSSKNIRVWCESKTRIFTLISVLSCNQKVHALSWPCKIPWRIRHNPESWW